MKEIDLIINLLDTYIEEANKLIISCNDKILNLEKIFNEFSKGIRVIKSTIGSIKNSLYSPDRLFLYCDNLEYIFSNILNENDIIKILKMEIIGLLYEFKNTIEAYNLVKNISSIQEYKDNREKKFLKANKTKEKIYKYEVTIVLWAYDKLEYTKKAIESIYKYTDFQEQKVELITINNGSNDETKKYFDSLPNTKKINLKYNIIGTNVHRHLVEGRYAVSFSNDVVATPNWLDNLLHCINSDDNIVMVVPTCNSDSISNNQGIEIDYENDINNIEKIDIFSQNYNKSRPELWEERECLMPFILISRVSFFHNTDGIDPLYYLGEFVDDDYSTSLRRAGLKQILAKDTFMHHFGSVTLRDARKNKSLENMRDVYYKKWGVDAWESRGIVEGIEHLLKYDIYDKPKVLFVEPKFGANTLNIKNLFRSRGIFSSKTIAAVFDKRYLPDATYMYDEILAVDNTFDLINRSKENYSLISFGSFINDIEKDDVISFLELLYHKIEDRGQIIFAIKNFRNANIIFDLLSNRFSEICGYEKIDFHGCCFNKLIEKLLNNKYLNSFNVHAIYSHTDEVDSILSLNNNLNNMSDSEIEQLKNEIGTKYYVISINKNC